MIPVITADGRVADTARIPITDEVATDVESRLAGTLGVMVRPVVDLRGVVHLHPEVPLSTYQEVVVLRAFLDVTDSPVAWHAAVCSDEWQPSHAAASRPDHCATCSGVRS